MKVIESSQDTLIGRQTVTDFARFTTFRAGELRNPAGLRSMKCWIAQREMEYLERLNVNGQS